MNYDSADLLSKLVGTLGLPATRSAPTDPQLYTLLSNAQMRMMQTFAAHVPMSQYSAPEKLLSTDGGYTYEFAFWPQGHAEIRERRNGPIIPPVADWTNDTAGCVLEGKLLRWPGGSARTFADGPYARYIRTPDPISATSQPVLEPPYARLAIVYDAAREWATQGGAASAEPYRDMLVGFLMGDPLIPGSVGIIPALKTQFMQSGGNDGRWWNTADFR